MRKINKVHVKSYRGLRDVRLEGLTDINVLIGPNTSGKTTVLEALHVIANPSSPGVLASLGFWRGMGRLTLHAPDALETIFRNMSLDDEVSIRCRTSEGEHQLALAPLRAGERKLIVESRHLEEEGSASPSIESDELLGIKFLYEPPSGSSVESLLELTSKGYEQTQGKLATRLRSFYIHARRLTSAAETAAAVTNLMENKCEDRFLHAMQKIDSRVQNILPGSRRRYPVLLVDIGLPHLILANVMGDGFCRVCLMVTGMVAKGTQLLIVDEIDSGLHKSVMAAFWKGMLQLSKHYQFQVFCSTHNEEMLHHTLEAFPDSKHALRIFRLERDENDEVTAEKYTYDLFQDAMKAGFDIR